MSLDYRICVPVVNKLVGLYPQVVVVYPLQKDIRDMINWCKECVGANQWCYYGEYRKIPYEFRFRKSEDLLAFKIKYLL